MRTTIKDSLQNDLFIDVAPKPCPTCHYPEVMCMSLESGHSFVAWCPCGTVYDEEGCIKISQHPAKPEWWKNQDK
jgi:hypothetical protein